MLKIRRHTDGPTSVSYRKKPDIDIKFLYGPQVEYTILDESEGYYDIIDCTVKCKEAACRRIYTWLSIIEDEERDRGQPIAIAFEHYPIANNNVCRLIHSLQKKIGLKKNVKIPFYRLSVKNRVAVFFVDRAWAKSSVHLHLLLSAIREGAGYRNSTVDPMMYLRNNDIYIGETKLSWLKSFYKRLKKYKPDDFEDEFYGIQEWANDTGGIQEDE